MWRIVGLYFCGRLWLMGSIFVIVLGRAYYLSVLVSHMYVIYADFGPSCWFGERLEYSSGTLGVVFHCWIYSLVYTLIGIFKWFWRVIFVSGHTQAISEGKFWSTLFVWSLSHPELTYTCMLFLVTYRFHVFWNICLGLHIFSLYYMLSYYKCNCSTFLEYTYVQCQRNSSERKRYI